MSYRVSRDEESLSQPPTAFGRRAPYTIESGSRRFSIRPLTLWGSVSLFAAMLVWTTGSAGYFAFSENVVTSLFARQGQMQRAYEDRIAELRGQIDRMTSRQLLDQEQVEQRIEQLVRRQATLESRAATLSNLPDIIVPPKTEAKIPVRPAIGTPAHPAPLTEPGTPTVLDRHSSLIDSLVPATRWRAREQRITVAFVRLEESLDRVEQHQNSRLLVLEDRYGARALRMRGVLAEIGIDLKKIAPSAPASGLGGPFVPVTSEAASAAFERQLERVQLARTHFDRLHKTLHTIPVRKPLSGEIDTSSGFGVRLDPFLRAPALHSGLDFRAPTGEPVRATAAGTVITAAWSGGYGRLVEIDHGNGLTTRYGHLSAILVQEDQEIKPGQIIGRVGSTGRSTGPHLHYETRIDGDPVDPIKFLRAGHRLDDRF